MADYAELDTIIGQMKRAAIDCWMADQSFDPDWLDKSYYSKWGWMENIYRRPDENGEGGGDPIWYLPWVDSITPQFDDIRSRIEGVVSKWRNLPDGSECEAPRSAVASTAAQLGSSPSEPVFKNNAEFAAAATVVYDNVHDYIKGSFSAPFIDKYHVQFLTVTAGLADACGFLDLNYAAQSEMWPIVREDVAATCKQAAHTWAEKAAHGAAERQELIFNVAITALGAAASIATAGAATVAVVTAFASATTLAKTARAAVEYEAAIEGDSYRQILTSLATSLDALDSVITDRERDFHNLLSGAASEMERKQAEFNLNAYDIMEFTLDDGVMSVESNESVLVSRSMTRIEGVLSHAVTTLGRVPVANPTPREAGIGFRASGTHEAASELHELAKNYLQQTSDEYTRGKHLFEAAVTDFFQADADSRREVEAMMEDEALNAGQTP